METAWQTVPAGWSRVTAAALEAFAARRFRPLAALVGAGSALLTFVVSSKSGFYHDDLTNLGEARDRGLTLKAIIHPVTEAHLMPVHRLLNWLILALGAHWWMAALFCSVMIGIAVVLIALVVREISATASVALVVAAIIGTSMVYLRVSLWWTEAIGEFPATALTMIMILAALRWDRTRSRKALAFSGLALLLALFCFDKYFTMIAPVAAVMALGLSDQREIEWQQFKTRIRSLAPLLAVWVGTVAIFLIASVIAIRAVGFPLASTATQASFRAYANFMLKWWEHSVPASLINVTPTLGRGDLPGLVVLIGLATCTIRGSRAWMLWAAAIAVIVGNSLVLAVGRLSTAALAIVYDPRYQDLTLLTLALLVPAAWRASGRPFPRSGKWLWLTLSAICALAAIWLYNGQQATREQVGIVTGAADYAERLNSTLTELRKSHKDLTLLDERASNTIVGRFVEDPYDRLSNVADLLAPDVHLTANQLTGTPVGVALNGAASVVSTTAPLAFLPPLAQCGYSSPKSMWLSTTASPFTAALFVPKPLQSPFGRILLTVRLRATNGRGTIAVTSYGAKFPSLKAPLGDHRDGLRLLIPARSSAILIQLWGGAAGCISGVEAARLG
ncbi:MAG: hypothetical protein WCL20_01180 [Actinomycetes bacterium]